MEYILYIMPFFEKHDQNKYCFNLENSPENLETFILNSNIETRFQENKCCLKCAFYSQLWYNEMILEKKEFKYTYKSYLSKYSIKNYDIISNYNNINHITMVYINPDKAKSVYNQLLKERAYKLSDISAYDTTKELLEYVIEKYDKYKILIFMENFL